MKSIELRRQNLIQVGDVTAFNEERFTGYPEAVLDELEANLPESIPVEDVWVSDVGVGLINKCSLVPIASSVIVKVHPNGTVQLRYSSDDIGQRQPTAIAQVVAEEYMISAEILEIVRGASYITLFDYVSISSRSTINMVNAVRMDCPDAKSELNEHASELLDVSTEDPETANRRL